MMSKLADAASNRKQQFIEEASMAILDSGMSLVSALSYVYSTQGSVGGEHERTTVGKEHMN